METTPTYDVITLNELFKTIKRRKWTLIFCCFLGLLMGFIYNRLATPIYNAPAIISFEQYGNDEVLNLGITGIQNQSNFVSNRIKEISTWGFARNVFEALPDSTRILLFQETELSSFAEVALQVPPDSITNILLSPESNPNEAHLARHLIEQIQENISVKQADKGANILTIAFESATPQLARDVTNIAVDVLNRRNLAYRRQEYNSLKEFIDQQLRVVEGNLDSAGQALQEFKGKNNIASLEDESREILSRITQAEILNNQIVAEAQAKLKKLSVLREKIDEEKENVSASSPETSNPMILKLREQLVQLEMESASLQVQGYASDHPRRLELKDEIELVKENLVGLTMGVIQDQNLKGMIDPLSSIKTYLEESVAIEIEIEALGAQQNHLQKTLKSYKNRLKTLSEKDVTLFGLQRDREVNNKLYVRLVEEREQARLREAAEIGSMRVIERAELPLLPYKPRKKLNLMVSFLAGSLIGLVVIFGKDSINDAPRAPEEVETVLDLPILTSIPKISRKRTVSLNGVSIDDYEIQFYQDAYTYLLYSLEAASIAEKPYSVMITSATPGEGKSTISVNLAITAAKFGHKTLLIDGDLRRPKLARLLNVPKVAEISNFDSENAEFPDLEIEGLKFINAGCVQEKPPVFWNSPEVKQAIDSLKKDFDFIVIDTPPVLGIPDAVSISPHVDNIILCVGVEQVDKTFLKRTKKILKQTKCNLVGVIWNKVDQTNIYGKYKYKNYYSVNGGTLS